MHPAGQRPEFFRRFADMGQAERDVGEEARAGLGQPDLPVTPLEQADAELRLQPLDGVGNRRLRHAELAAGGGEAGQPRRRLEDDQRAGRRQQMAKALHKLSLYKR